MFAGQFILSLFLGALIHTAGTTLVVPICGAVCSLLAAIAATRVEYVEG